MLKKIFDQSKSKEFFDLDMYMTLLTATSCIIIEILFQQLANEFNLAFSFLRIGLCFLSLLLIQHYSAKAMLRFKPDLKDFLLFHGLLIFSGLIFWIGKIFSLALSDYLKNQFDFFKLVSDQAIDFAIPFAFAGLLIAVIKGMNYGLVFAICFSIMVGIYLPGDPLIIPYVLLTNLIACLSLADLRSRSTYLRAAFKIALIALPFAIVGIIHADTFAYSDLIVRVLTPIISGLLAVAIAGALTPLLEQVGGYVTDLRLIEMSTLDHPLLKELSIQAPGTWNHSMVVGMMVEAAADEVGANKVLARVGAYFHDVGKVKKPAYFIENQKGGENKHDKLSPSMSALIIRAHVKDGAEMAKEHRLPQPIIDLILQHHGTSLIEYFYNRAKQEAEEDEDIPNDVDKSLYTYPGPKPQTRIAGLLMLADVIESSSRTLSDYSFDRIQQHVQKMINKVFASAQLEESDLTLRDLHNIAKVFTRVLTGIHHQRIQYNQEPEKTSDKDKSDKNSDKNIENSIEVEKEASPKTKKDSTSKTEPTKKSKTSKKKSTKNSEETASEPRKSQAIENLTPKEVHEAKKAKEAEDKNLKRLGVE